MFQFVYTNKQANILRLIRSSSLSWNCQSIIFGTKENILSFDLGVQKDRITSFLVLVRTKHTILLNLVFGIKNESCTSDISLTL